MWMTTLAQKGAKQHARLCLCWVLRGCRPETMEHCKWIFARLVRMLLGQSAIAERKLLAGKSLVILGIMVRARLLAP